MIINITDIGQAMTKFQGMVFVFHRNFRGEKTSEGILFKGQPYPTIEAFQQAVDNYIIEGGIIIGNSLNRINK